MNGQQLCVSSKHYDVYQKASRFSTAMLNYSQALNALREELIAFKIGLHNFGYILDEAFSSLTRGLFPATLIPPEVLKKVLDGLKLYRMREAIPRSELMTYYGFGLVNSTVITTTGTIVLVKIPLHDTSGLYHVYRAVALANLLTMELQQPNFCSESLVFYFRRGKTISLKCWKKKLIRTVWELTV